MECSCLLAGRRHGSQTSGERWLSRLGVEVVGSWLSLPKHVGGTPQQHTQRWHSPGRERCRCPLQDLLVLLHVRARRSSCQTLAVRRVEDVADLVVVRLARHLGKPRQLGLRQARPLGIPRQRISPPVAPCQVAGRPLAGLAALVQPGRAVCGVWEQGGGQRGGALATAAAVGALPSVGQGCGGGWYREWKINVFSVSGL